MTDIIAGRKATGKFFASTGLKKFKQCILSKDKWDEQKVTQQQQEQALRKADELAQAKVGPFT